MDWPQGSVFDNIAGAASWCGYPVVLQACMEICNERFNSDCARHSIERAIRSHNRDGDIKQYHELIQSQLEFLKLQNSLSDGFENGDPFCPLHWLAEDFIEPQELWLQMQSAQHRSRRCSAGQAVC